MRGPALLGVFAVATFFACSDSRNTGVLSDAGPETGSIKPTGDAGSSSSDKDSGKKPVSEDDSGTPSASCTPGSVGGFTPQWTPPAVLHAGACSATQISTLLECLFDPNASQTTCDAFQQATANKSCVTCAVTPSSAASWGPLVVSQDNLVSLNLAGCVARTSNDVSATSCGAKMQAAQQCSSAACEANCPVPSGDDQALQARNDCETQADTTVCKTYTTDAKTCSDTLLQGASSACAQGQTFDDAAKNLVTMFCGN